jgi:uncharacterized membrane protein
LQTETDVTRLETQQDQAPRRWFAALPGLVIPKTGAGVFRLVLLSGMLITAARLVGPFELGKDQSLQLDAAVRLATGFGLTTAYDSSQSFDITESSIPKHLTWWPPALSMLIAGFLYIGVPLAVSLKIVYAATTIAGWVGWANLAGSLLSKPITLGNRMIRLGLLIAVVCPILYTPTWGAAPEDGTDIFLWAGVPWVVILLFRLGLRPTSWGAVVLAGLLCGSLYAFRYASLFVCFAATLIILQVTIPDYRRAIGRILLLAGSALILILPTLVYTRAYSADGSVLPEYVSVERSAEDRAVNVLNRLAISSEMVFAVPTVQQLIYRTGSLVIIRAAGLICLFIVVALPFAVLKSRRSDPDIVHRGERVARTDLALSLSFVPLSLMFFSILATFALGWSPLGHSRYYVPVLLCCLFIAFQIFSARLTHPVVRTASAAIVGLFLLHVFVYTPIRLLVPGTRTDLVRRTLSFTPARDSRYTSTSLDSALLGQGVYSLKENSRRKLKELYERNPEAIFFVDPYACYAYDGFWQNPETAGKTFKYLPSRDFWRKAYTSRPVKVFWFVTDPSDPRVPLTTFIPEANFKMIFFDPFEKTKAFESEFPADYRFFGNPRLP